MPAAALVLGLLSAGACASPGASGTAASSAGAAVPRPGDASTAIDRQYERFRRAYLLGQPDSVLVLYTDDALYLPAQGDVRRGQAQLRGQFGFLDGIRQRGARAHIRFESIDRDVDGSLAYDIGYYTLRVENADGTMSEPSRGKFTTVWRRGADGVWRIHADSFSPAPPNLGEPVLEEQASGTSVLLQAVSIVDSATVWISGHGGTFARTTDGGRTWRAAVVPGADTLQFRDVHAADARTAWLLSAGPGPLSRIFRTDDAGATWTEQWVNDEPDGFYDCLDFWDRERGIVYGDAVGGAPRVLLTDDGGRTWRRVPDAALPPAQPGEGGFAASGTCVQTGPDGRAWIAAGNAQRARVFLTGDYGRTWSAADVPVEAGEAAGLTSISMLTVEAGTAFGGNLGVRDRRTRNLARTLDGGRTWRPLPEVAMNGAVYGGTHVPYTEGRVLLAVGPGGADVSHDAGMSWRTLDARSWWGLGSTGPQTTWLVGPEGRVARVRWR